MFKLIKIKNYDVHHSYGNDWCTDYYFETDMNLNAEEVISELKKLGYCPCGEYCLIDNVLKTKLY